MRLTVHVHPGSKSPGVGGSYDGKLVVRVRERAVDGSATNAVAASLAAAFSVTQRSVVCIRGAISRTKTFDIEGDEATLGATLAKLLQ
ncbi:MAG: DUF167 domain-containing protein [Actinobacteria bacterium]|uniref:Unannotated protein n=1 Tax=freshwater metagenome TaxID=449393 RepID=A0A6J6WJK0_9ZZZZ|nr:DUF167 domain-containing protein [Actinomycetota bacterium]